MSLSVSKELMDRLVCSKYIFRRGQETLFSNSPYSSGEGVLQFQDSVEMALRVVAEFLHCSVTPRIGFDALLDLIDKSGTRKLSHRSALIQLNKSRVNFKHHGLSPKRQDALKFSSDLEGFFPVVFQDYLSLNFSSISLVNIIVHRRTQNYLKKAEEFLAKDAYQDSVKNSAIAFKVFQNSIKAKRIVFQTKLYGHFLGQDPQNAQWKSKVENAIDDHQSLLDLIVLGIDMSDYQRFVSFTPNVLITMGGVVQVTPRGLFGPLPDCSLEDSLFCHRFVLESVMKIEQTQIISKHTISHKRFGYLVTSPSSIVVYPNANPEVICTVNPGDIVISDSAKVPNESEYLKIRFQDDYAYIKSEHLSKKEQDKG